MGLGGETERDMKKSATVWEQAQLVQREGAAGSLSGLLLEGQDIKVGDTLPLRNFGQVEITESLLRRAEEIAAAAPYWAPADDEDDD